MSNDTPLALVLAGNGSTTKKNAHDLLDLNIPEGDISPFTVERIPRGKMEGLRTALDWFKTEDLEVERLEDPIAKLKEYQKRKGWDTLLLMVPDFDNEDDVALINAAHEAGILVKDLSGAYDDILPLEAKEEEPATALEVASNIISYGSTPGELTDTLWANFRGAFEALVVDLAKRYANPGEVITEAASSLAALERDVEDAPFEGGTQVGSATRKPGTTKFLMNEDGKYRSAEGRRKKGDEVVVYLTDDEIASLPRAVYDPEA